MRIMGLLEDTKRDVAVLPGDVSRMNKGHWAVVARTARRLRTEFDGTAEAFKRSLHVDERSRDVEKQWYKATLTRAEGLFEAFAIFDEWWRAADVRSFDESAEANHEQTRRSVALLQIGLRRIGDPTAPGWRPPRTLGLISTVRRALILRGARTR